MKLARGDIIEFPGINVNETEDRVRLQKMEQLNPLFMPRLGTE